MSADRNAADRAFRRQHSVAGRRDRVPHLVGRGRAHVARLPDGETGIRKTWIRFLQDVLASNPAIEYAKDVPPFKFTQWDGKVIREIPRLRLKGGAVPDPNSFTTGYADMAIEFVGLVRPPAAGGRHSGRASSSRSRSRRRSRRPTTTCCRPTGRGCCRR